MTIAGAAASGLLDKVGTLTPGKEADIVILDFNNINYQPMNNAYGTIVTMMDTTARAARDDRGQVRVLARHAGGLGRGQADRDRSSSRATGCSPASTAPRRARTRTSSTEARTAPAIPYRPAFLTSCCYNGQNERAPHYVLRP